MHLLNKMPVGEYSVILRVNGIKKIDWWISSALLRRPCKMTVRVHEAKCKQTLIFKIFVSGIIGSAGQGGYSSHFL